MTAVRRILISSTTLPILSVMDSVVMDSLYTQTHRSHLMLNAMKCPKMLHINAEMLVSSLTLRQRK